MRGAQVPLTKPLQGSRAPRAPGTPWGTLSRAFWGAQWAPSLPQRCGTRATCGRIHLAELLAAGLSSTRQYMGTTFFCGQLCLQRTKVRAVRTLYHAIARRLWSLRDAILAQGHNSMDADSSPLFFCLGRPSTFSLPNIWGLWFPSSFFVGLPAPGHVLEIASFPSILSSILSSVLPSILVRKTLEPKSRWCDSVISGRFSTTRFQGLCLDTTVQNMG